MNPEKVSIVRLAPTHRAARAAETLKSPGTLANARILKSEGKTWVRLVGSGDAKFVVKCRPLNNVRKRVASLIGHGHAHRQWRGAERLQRADIATGTPLAIARAVIDGMPCELLALEYIEGPTLLEVMSAVAKHAPDAPSVRVQHAIARAAAESVRKLLTAGLANRDHKPSNLVVIAGSGSGSGPEVAVIDCVAIKRYGRLGIDKLEGEEMLAALLIEPIGCGCRPRRSLWMRGLRVTEQGACSTRGERRRNIRALLEDVQRLINVHGDPAPRTNPLAHAQRNGSQSGTISP